MVGVSITLPLAHRISARKHHHGICFDCNFMVLKTSPVRPNFNNSAQTDVWWTFKPTYAQDTGNYSTSYVPRMEFSMKFSNIFVGSDAFSQTHGPTNVGYYLLNATNSALVNYNNFVISCAIFQVQAVYLFLGFVLCNMFASVVFKGSRQPYIEAVIKQSKTFGSSYRDYSS